MSRSLVEVKTAEGEHRLINPQHIVMVLEGQHYDPSSTKIQLRTCGKICMLGGFIIYTECRYDELKQQLHGSGIFNASHQYRVLGSAQKESVKC